MKQTYKVTFGDVKIGKKTTIAIEIKGDLSDSQKLALLEFAQSDGFVQLATAQRDIDDYSPVKPHEGIQYKLDGGEVKVDHDQLNIDDVVQEAIYEGNPEEDLKDPNWLEQEEEIARQEAASEEELAAIDEEETQEEDELSDELE